VNDRDLLFVRQVFNDITMENQFVVDQVHSALSADGLKSHSLSYDVNSPSEIRSMFSTISYNKGASILRMIERSYGEQVFYEALSNYLEDRYVSRTKICLLRRV
jgi:aminopeptidase N